MDDRGEEDIARPTDPTYCVGCDAALDTYLYRGKAYSNHGMCLCLKQVIPALAMELALEWWESFRRRRMRLIEGGGAAGAPTNE